MLQLRGQTRQDRSASMAYTGGKSYFKLALPKFDQKASYFALQNDKWTLAALDTSYVDHDLYGGQAQWLNGLASQLDGRRAVARAKEIARGQLGKVFLKHSTLNAQRPMLNGRLQSAEHRTVVFEHLS